MANLSKMRRDRMIAFLEQIRAQYTTDDDMLIAIGEIENELTSKKYGLLWEEHEEAVDVAMRESIPVFTVFSASIIRWIDVNAIHAFSASFLQQI